MGFLIAAGVLLLIGVGTLMYYRHIAHQNFFFRRAPELKVSDVHAYDDGFFTGMIEAPQVVIPPYFGHHTVYFKYCLYQKVVKYEKDSSGKSRRVESWELYDSSSDSTAFFLNDGSGNILIHPGPALKKFPFSDFHQTENWRHTLSYLPSTGIISSVGVVSEDKKQLAAKGEIPLMVTPMGRKTFMDSLRNEEKTNKIIGFISLWCSLVCGLYGLNEEYLGLSGSDGQLFVMFALLACIAFAGFYYYFTHNTLVNLRTKLINSWANVDIELKQRRELIPNLVKVCEQYMNHEKETLSRLAELRTSLVKEKRLNDRVAGENEVSKHLTKVIATLEAYPNLSDETLQKLQLELVIIENKIAHAKSHFNAVVEEYNSLVESVPSKFIASNHKFIPVPFYGGVEEVNLKILGRAQAARVAEKPKKAA